MDKSIFQSKTFWGAVGVSVGAVMTALGVPSGNTVTIISGAFTAFGIRDALPSNFQEDYSGEIKDLQIQVSELNKALQNIAQLVAQLKNK